MGKTATHEHLRAQSLYEISVINLRNDSPWQIYASKTKEALDYQGLRQKNHLVPGSLFL